VNGIFNWNTKNIPMDHLIKHLILYTWKKNKTTSSIINQKKKKKMENVESIHVFCVTGRFI